MTKDEKKIVRAPISVIMGHVDSGKTSLLDLVRKTVVQNREAGGITQHIGASLFPKETIFEMSKALHKGKLELKTPGILIIDTPGHEAFMTLRTRGASVADIAILVVDLTKGFQAQTFESIETLKRRKVPFVIAANKVDRIGGWQGKKDMPFVESYKLQNKTVQARLDSKLYEFMGELGNLGLKADRYDKIKNFKKNIAIVPTSATTGEGVADLFLVLTGLTQQFMMEKLEYSIGPGKGVILEVKEETGMGTTLDVILFNGVLEKTDTLVLSGKNGPIVSKIKALMLPKPLDEIRDPRDKFQTPKIIYAAAGLKISAANISDAISGGTIFGAKNKKQIEEFKEYISEERKSLHIDTQETGIMVRTDTLGSLEALLSIMKEKGIPIRSADVGDISKRDVTDASIIARNNPEYGVILAFNVKIKDEAEELAHTEGVEVFSDPIIYRMIENFMEWTSELQEIANASSLADIPKPTKIEHIPEYVFKRNKPMVIGVRILGGELKPRDVLLTEDNIRVGTIQQIKLNNDPVKKATKDEEVSIAVRGPTFGRQIKKGQSLYIDMRTKHAYQLLTKYNEELTAPEREILSSLEKLKKKAGLKFWPFAD
uniref:Probable translation initiation factor IF-2 n=1 Tax=uncultured organism TaxID=155900 RepID=A0A0F6PZS2_9ZZZZ|nr:putative translation initiation factor IF-2 [uncultured organism]